MFDFKNGEIYLVRFEPSVGHEFQKNRPAIVVQSNSTLQKSSLITVMPITTSIKNKRPEDLVIKKDAINRLYENSVIKVAAVHSFDRSRFLKKIGNTNMATLNAIKNYLRKHFDF